MGFDKKKSAEPEVIITADPFGFVPAKKYVPKKLVISIEGETGTRKTGFALSAPGGIKVYDTDAGIHRAINRYIDKKEIQVISSDGDLRSNPLAVLAKEDLVSNQAQAQVLWNTIKATWYPSLEDSDSSKTVVMDTATHLWEIAQWAEMGKIEIERRAIGKDVMGFHYGIVNQQFRSIMQSAMYSKKNVIFTHRIKEVWDSKGPTGKMELAGFKHMKYEVDVRLLTEMIMGKQQITVFKADAYQEKEGTVYKGDEHCNFAHIASDITGTPIENWR